MEIVKPSVELLAVTPNAEQLIEQCGRICWKSEDRITPDSHVAFIRMLLKRGHESVIEHASATLKFVTDIGVSREADRHRISSFSMESTRFCNYGQEKHDGIRVIPMLDGLNEYQLTRRQNLYSHIEQVYLAELAEGIKPQQARDVLPLSLKTEYAWSANFRNWRHIFRVRLARAAHPQLRVVMRMAFEILHGVAPTVFPTEEFLKEEA